MPVRRIAAVPGAFGHRRRRQAPETLFLTTIGLAELWAGIETLPAGRRRARLHHSITEQIGALFRGRILPFDVEAARAFGQVFAGVRTAGHSIEFADCAIAAIASARGFAIATRNTRDFRGTGIDLLNPWT